MLIAYNTKVVAKAFPEDGDPDKELSKGGNYPRPEKRTDDEMRKIHKIDFVKNLALMFIRYLHLGNSISVLI